MHTWWNRMLLVALLVIGALTAGLLLDGELYPLLGVVVAAVPLASWRVADGAGSPTQPLRDHLAVLVGGAIMLLGWLALPASAPLTTGYLTEADDSPMRAAALGIYLVGLWILLRPCLTVQTPQGALGARDLFGRPVGEPAPPETEAHPAQSPWVSPVGWTGQDVRETGETARCASDC